MYSQYHDAYWVRRALYRPRFRGHRVRAALLGGPEVHPNCGLRDAIIGPKRPEDRRRALIMCTWIVVSQVIFATLLVHHGTWMFYIELLISLCT